MAAVDAVLVGPEVEENLSLRYLASACRAAGYTTQIAAFNSEADTQRTLDCICSVCPALVGLSLSIQTRSHEFARVGQELRKRGFSGHITAGGHFATLRTEFLLTAFPWLDSIVVHEGEQTLPALLGELRSSEPALLGMPGLAVRDSGRVVLGPARELPPVDSLPWPERQRPMPNTLGLGTAIMLGGRGCYGSCKFCSVQTWYKSARGPRVRQRSIEDIAAEMAWLRTQHGVRVFAFHDDNFFSPVRTHNLERLEQLTSAVKAKGLTDVAWSFKCRPNDLDAESLELVTRIPVVLAYVGIETTSPQGIRTLGRGVDSHHNTAALRLLRESNVPHTFNLMLFDPDTTLESMVPNLELLQACTEVPWNFCRLEVYAGTPIEERLLRENRLRGDGFGWTYDLPDARADLMYRIAAVAFQKRNFHPEGIASLHLSTRYGVELLRNFGTAPWDNSLEEQMLSASRAINSSSMQHLFEIREYAASAAIDDHQRQEAFTVDVARAVHRSDFEALKLLRQVRSQIQGKLRPLP